MRTILLDLAVMLTGLFGRGERCFHQDKHVLLWLGAHATGNQRENSQGAKLEFLQFQRGSRSVNKGTHLVLMAACLGETPLSQNSGLRREEWR